MRILAFDTSSAWCSVALGEGERWMQLEEPLDQTHSERLLPIAQRLVADAGWSLHDLDGIGFGAGPGSFTGVRIACGVAQGLGFGLDRPLVAVCTLEAVAQEAAARHGVSRVLACTDARMGEIYAAAYTQDRDAWDEIATPQVLSPLTLGAPPGGHWVGAGNAFAAYPDLAARAALGHAYADVRPTGRAVGALAQARLLRGEGVPAEAAQPRYVRQRVALTSAERAAGLRLQSVNRP